MFFDHFVQIYLFFRLKKMSEENKEFSSLREKLNVKQKFDEFYSPEEFAKNLSNYHLLSGTNFTFDGVDQVVKGSDLYEIAKKNDCQELYIHRSNPSCFFYCSKRKRIFSFWPGKRVDYLMSLDVEKNLWHVHKTPSSRDSYMVGCFNANDELAVCTFTKDEQKMMYISMEEDGWVVRDQSLVTTNMTTQRNRLSVFRTVGDLFLLHDGNLLMTRQNYLYMIDVHGGVTFKRQLPSCLDVVRFRLFQHLNKSVMVYWSQSSANIVVSVNENFDIFLGANRLTIEVIEVFHSGKYFISVEYLHSLAVCGVYLWDLGNLEKKFLKPINWFFFEPSSKPRCFFDEEEKMLYLLAENMTLDTCPLKQFLSNVYDKNKRLNINVGINEEVNYDDKK